MSQGFLGPIDATQTHRGVSVRESCYRAAIETVVDGFVIADRDGRLLEVNDAYLRRSGYGREQLLGRQIHDLEAREGREEITDPLEKCKREGRHRFESLHRTGDGSAWPVEVIVTFWPHEGGRFFCQIRDTRRRDLPDAFLRARLELCELSIRLGLEEFVASALEAVVNHLGGDVGSLEVTPRTGEKPYLIRWPSISTREPGSEAMEAHADDRANDTWPEVIPYPSGNSSSRAGSISERVTDDRAAPDRAAPCDCRAQFTVSVVRGGGFRAVLSVSGLPGNSTPRDVEVMRQLAFMVADLAAKKHDEALLHIQAAALDASASAIVITDREARIIYANPAFGDMTGYDLADVIGRNPSELVRSGEHPREFYEALWQTILRGDVWRGEITNRRKDGSLYNESLTIMPVADDRGIIRHFVAIKQDDTERKLAEETLRHRLDLQDQLTSIAMSVPGAIHSLRTRADGTCCMPYAAPAIEELLGISHVELAHDLTRLHENLHPDDRDSARESLARAARRMAPWHDVYRYRHPVRGDCWIEGWSVPWAQDDGGVLWHGFLMDVTARKRAEQDLFETRERLRFLTDNLPDSAVYQYLLEPDGSSRFVYLSAGIEHLNLVNRDDAIRDVGTLHGQIPAAYRDRMMVAEAESARNLTDFDMEVPMYRRDSQVRWMRLHSRPRRLEDGRVIWDGVQTDVTALKLAEDEIRRLNAELERRVGDRTAELESMLENAAVGLAFFDRDGRYVRVNHYLAGLNQRPVEDHLGRTISEVLPHLAGIVEPQIREVFETGAAPSSSELEDPESTPEELKRSFLCRLYPVFDANGTVQLVGGSVSDITELKQQARQLASLNSDLRSEMAKRVRIEDRMRRLASVLEASTDFVAIADPHGAIHYCNAAFAAITGVTPESSGIAFTDCHPGGAGRRIIEEGLQTAATVGVWWSETELIARDGRMIPVSQLILGHRDDQGRLEYLSTIMRDISERKSMEETLRRRGEELALANAQLARAARLKDEFLASMSHELRTPLTGILGLSESFREGVYGTLSRDQEQPICDIEESGRHLLALINDILDVAKVEAGRMELINGPISIREVCTASIRLVKETAHRKDIKVQLTLDDAVESLIADERRLKQILVNLLSNAVKFTPRGGEVGLEVIGDRAGGRVRFLVRDTGIGIDPGALPRLFQPFSQLDSRLARQYEGTGLGLALVKRLSELHRGDVVVESTPGVGSLFTVILPWIQVPRSDDGQAETRTSDGSPAPCQSRGTAPLILVIEDNRVIAITLRDYLLFRGYRVELEDDGNAGIRLAGLRRPDLILIDVQLPGLDGHEAIQGIRALPGMESVPVVALTAHAMPGDRERSLAAGATEYLSKPVVLEDLRRLIESLLIPGDAECRCHREVPRPS